METVQSKGFDKKLFKSLIMFTLPLMATSMLQLLYNAVDLIVIGQFCSETHVAAVGSTSSLCHLIVNFFIGMSTGTLSIMARAFGAKDEQRADKIVHTAIPLSIIGGIVIGLIGFFSCRTLLEWMGSPENVIDLSTTYVKIYFLGVPFQIIYNFGSSIIRALGDTKTPLVILTAAGITNVILNYILVKFAHLDVAGVAIATAISQLISAVSVIVVLMLRKGYGHFSFKKMKMDLSVLADITKIGLPAGIQSLIFSLSNVIIQSSVNSFGSDVILAGNSAASNIEGFVYNGMNSLYSASLAFVARYYGAKDKERMRKSYYYAMISVFVTGLVLGGLVLLFGNQLLGLYNGTGNPDVIKYGLLRNRVIASTYFLCGFMEVTVGALRGMGASTVPMIGSIVGVCGIRIGWIFLIFNANPSLFTLYISYPISWIATTIFQIGIYIYTRKKIEKEIAKKQENQEVCV